MENMFELMATKPAVDDAPGAAPLALTRGDVAFDNVTFRWVPPGQHAGIKTGLGDSKAGCSGLLLQLVPGKGMAGGQKGNTGMLHATRLRTSRSWPSSLARFHARLQPCPLSQTLAVPALQLRHGRTRPPQRLLLPGGGPDAGPGGRHRQRQVHHRPTAAALLRPLQRACAHRRRRRGGSHAELAAPRHRRGAPRLRAVQRHHCLQHRCGRAGGRVARWASSVAGWPGASRGWRVPCQTEPRHVASTPSPVRLLARCDGHAARAERCPCRSVRPAGGERSRGRGGGAGGTHTRGNSAALSGCVGPGPTPLQGAPRQGGSESPAGAHWSRLE